MRIAAFILQLICLVLSMFGTGVEFVYEADIGFVLITLATIIFAVSTKLYKLALLKENKQLKRKEQNECKNKNQLVSKVAL